MGGGQHPAQPVDATSFKTYIILLHFQIACSDWNLNLPRYVEPLVEEEAITVEEAVANLRAALADTYAAEDRLKSLLQSAGLIA